jgi:hypothetical protein
VAGRGFRGNIALYTIAKVLVQKSRNFRTWPARSWNWTIRRVRSSLAQKSLPFCLASRRRISTRELTRWSSTAASIKEPRTSQEKQDMTGHTSTVEKNKNCGATYPPYLDSRQSSGRAYNFHGQQLASLSYRSFL